MSIPKRTPAAPASIEKTSENAQIIYDMIMTTGNVTLAFKSLNYPEAYVRFVYQEIKRMENLAIVYVQVNPDCSAGDVITAIASNWLDEATVGGDIVKYNPTWDAERTFEEFKAEYVTTEE